MSTLNRLVTVFTARTTSFTAGTQKMALSMKAFRASVMASSRAISSSIQRIGLATGIVTGFSIKHYAMFEKRMAAVGAVARANARDFKDLTELAKKLGRETVFTATEAAEAQQVMAMAGLNATEIMQALGPALQLAAVGEVEVAQAAETAALTMRGMQLESTDLLRVNNVLAGAMTTSTTNMTQLGDALKYVAPLAAATNTSIEDTVAMIGKLSSAGFQGEMAGTGLRQAMAKLAGSTPHATKVLNDLGIRTVDASGNMLPMISIIGQMEQAGLNAGQVFEIFGARAGPQMLALLGVGAQGLRDYSATLQQAHRDGLAARIEQQKLNTIWGDWKRMVAAVSGVVIDAVERMAPAIRETQRSFIGFFNNVENREAIVEKMRAGFLRVVNILKSMGKWLVANTPKLLGMAAAIGAVVGQVYAFIAAHPKLMVALLAIKATGLLGINTAVLSLLPLLGQLGMILSGPLLSALGAVGTHFAIIFSEFAFSGGLLLGLKAGFIAIGVALGTLAIALAKFIAIAAGIATVGYAVYKLVTRSESLSEGWEYIKSLFMEVWGIIKERLWPSLMKIGDQLSEVLVPVVELLAQVLGVGLVVALHAVIVVLEVMAFTLDLIVGLFETIGKWAQWVATIGISDDSARGKQLDAELKLHQDTLRFKEAQWKKEDEEREKQKKHEQDMAARRKKTWDDHAARWRQAQGISPGGARPHTAGGAAAPGASGGGVPGVPGMAGGAGGSGGGGGDAADPAKALASRQADASKASTAATLGRTAAREGSELGSFLELGPDVQQLHDYVATIPNLTDAQKQHLLDMRSAHIKAGLSIEEANQRMQTQLEGDIYLGEQRRKQAKAQADAVEQQQQVGSLTRRLDAIARFGTEEEQLFFEQSQKALTSLRQQYANGQLTQQQYEMGLARLNHSFQSATGFLQAQAQAQHQVAGASEAVRNHIAGLRGRFLQLQKQLHMGQITQEQYNIQLRNLNKTMKEGTEAAKQEAAAKQKTIKAQRDMVRKSARGGGGGGGSKSGGGGKAHPMDWLLSKLSMAQAKAQLLMPSKEAFGRTISDHRLGDIRKRRQSFSGAVAEVQHIQKLISNMRMGMTRGPTMQMRGFATLDDPGMVTQQQGAVTISLPNVTRMNNEEIASVSDRLDEYRSRQGRQVV